MNATDYQPQLQMTPAPGEGLLRFVGDRVQFSLCEISGRPVPEGWRAFLRTNLGRARLLRAEHVADSQAPLRGMAWRDLPMAADGERWLLELPLVEVGFFEAKAYLVGPRGCQVWPAGANVGLSVHPDDCRTHNILYCAFVRLFGPSRNRNLAADPTLEPRLKELDRLDYAVIPPSGKLRDLTEQVPHILDTLGCRIIHLLPVNPTPTTFARMGRYGSPYACLNLASIDPALVVFDRRSTAVDQFRELAYAIHARGGRLFLDLAINHTGWGSNLHEEHPEWYLRDDRGQFVCPGAWGTIWEDLCELDHRQSALWRYLADVFLLWCRRGVDGFRCDAGYKVPTAAWQYITSRVRQEFPDTVFLLEGLGGAWADTERLLTEGGMQWAYSELFQNYSGSEVSGYLDYSLRQSQRLGLWVHYSETHDNDRLAKKGRDWSLLRNRLAALTSMSAGFGFACGVEWLAAEKIDVHGCGGLAWGDRPNLLTELTQLNRLLADHPCFFDHAPCARLSPPDSPVLALRRDSAEGLDHVLVLVNLEVDHAHSILLPEAVYGELGQAQVDLLGQKPPRHTHDPAARSVTVWLPPGAAFCLAACLTPVGLHGPDYRLARSQCAWALQAIRHVLQDEDIGPMDWRALARLVSSDPRRFVEAVTRLRAEPARNGLAQALAAEMQSESYAPVVTWDLLDQRRIFPLPAGHWLLLQDTVPFRLTVTVPSAIPPSPSIVPLHLSSLPVQRGHVALVAPGQLHLPTDRAFDEVSLELERYGLDQKRVQARLMLLPSDEVRSAAVLPRREMPPTPAVVTRYPAEAMVLLTNGLGGMARLAVDLGRIESKYDCLLGANLHPQWPVDRHVLAKRARVWVNADGFISPLNGENLIHFEPGPPAEWRFVASAGDGRVVEVRLTVDMLPGLNTTVMLFHRPSTPAPFGTALSRECRVSLTVRVDVEDRNFHTETQGHEGAQHHFAAHCRPMSDRPGVVFTPAEDRRLRVYSDQGSYHPEGEWVFGIFHPVEAARGQPAHGDAFSPGWFELPLPVASSCRLTVSADLSEPSGGLLEGFPMRRRRLVAEAWTQAEISPEDDFGRRLASALRAFVVRRGEGRTVVAGYPWFLDWGRDTLIAARGLLAAGMADQVRQLLLAFGSLEKDGTLPNSLQGADTSNRDTSDAPLWFGLATQETAASQAVNPQGSIYEMTVGHPPRKLAEVLRSIAVHFLQGTPNRIRWDPTSGLIWSPAHFTWMDTQYPAATPRAGYPIEIQVLWILLLRQLERLNQPAPAIPWGELAAQALTSLNTLFWLRDCGYLADVIHAPAGQPARQGIVDHALRGNGLFAVSLELVTGHKARSCVEAARRTLLVPGGLRSLAPLPVSPPLPVTAADGRLLNDPQMPYWGSYQGDEDTRRKPAYHNGTAWTWLLPVFCEALARAWDFAPDAMATAGGYLRSMEWLMQVKCQGQLPEILDGDAPHHPRGCDAQAWAISETLRVWKLLKYSSYAKSDRRL